MSNENDLTEEVKKKSGLTIKIRQPKPYWEWKKEPRSAFQSWLDLFETYIANFETKTGKKFSDKEKTMLFFSNLGEEGETHLQSHPIIQDLMQHGEPVYETLAETAREVFGNRKTRLTACHEFFKTCQQSDETFDAFLARLQTAILDCGFDQEVSTDLIAILFFCGLKDLRAIEQILEEPSINLKRFVEVAKAHALKSENGDKLEADQKTVDAHEKEIKPTNIGESEENIKNHKDKNSVSSTINILLMANKTGIREFLPSLR